MAFCEIAALGLGGGSESGSLWVACSGMPSSLLYFTYGGVMLAALVCFVRAFQTRLDTPVHKRWGIAGVALSLGGILVVVFGAYVFGWQVNIRSMDVVIWHRRIALVSLVLLCMIAITGATKHRLHRRLYVVFLPVYVVSLITAAIGYQP